MEYDIYIYICTDPEYIFKLKFNLQTTLVYEPRIDNLPTLFMWIKYTFSHDSI